MSLLLKHFAAPCRLGILLVAAACGCSAQAAVAACDFSQAQQQRLANGMQVVVLEDRALPLVAVDLYLAGGASAEPPGASGVAHLVLSLIHI